MSGGRSGTPIRLPLVFRSTTWISRSPLRRKPPSDSQCCGLITEAGRAAIMRLPWFLDPLHESSFQQGPVVDRRGGWQAGYQALMKQRTTVAVGLANRLLVFSNEHRQFFHASPRIPA